MQGETLKGCNRAYALDSGYISEPNGRLRHFDGTNVHSARLYGVETSAGFYLGPGVLDWATGNNYRLVHPNTIAEAEESTRVLEEGISRVHEALTKRLRRA